MALDPLRKGYVQLLRGEIQVNGTAISSGDAIMLDGESLLTLTDGKDAEVLVFDLHA
jgi:redox-sensitive bicupin YhaK (pirin superfamily)